MAGKNERSSVMNVLAAFMKKHPDATYLEVRESLGEEGHRVYPIMWDRVRVLPEKPKRPERSKKKAAPKKVSKRGAVSRSGKKVSSSEKAQTSVKVANEDLPAWKEIVSRLNNGEKMKVKKVGKEWRVVSG